MIHIDIDRCLQAMGNLSVKGDPRAANRQELIEQAISRIRKDSQALLDLRMGFKNYAGFGDQREDHEYGYGPKHGYMVFEIGRTYRARDNKTNLGPDEIYLLECVRDFGVLEIGSDRDKRCLNLVDAIDERVALLNKLAPLDKALASATVDQQAIQAA